MNFPRLLGTYTLLSQLGEGGMGRVYLAISGKAGLETLCVVKTILPELKADIAAVSRFRHEADVVRRLVHGNLVSTHSIGDADGEVFLVQDFVEGHDLGTFLDKVVLEADKPPHELSCYIIREVARALAYAHSFEGLGLVHCDLSPTNIRLTYAGEVKLMDFGVAASRLLAANDPAATVRFGKLAYMAPEQIEGGELSPAADVYAMGVLLWEMLTAHPLGTELKTRGIVRPGEGSSDELKTRLASKFEYPSTFDPRISAELDALVMAMLDRVPAERPTAEAVRVWLSDFVPAKFNPEGALASAMARYFRPSFEREARDALVTAARSHSPVPHKMASTSAAASKTLPMQSARPTGSNWWAVAGMVIVAFAAGGMWLAARPAPKVERRAPQAESPKPDQPPPAVPIAVAPPAVENPPAVAQPVFKPRQNLTSSRPDRKVNGEQLQPTLPKASADVELAAAKEAFARRDLDSARASAQRAVDAGGGAEAYSVLGSVLFKAERWQDSVAAFTKASQLSPGDALVAQRLRLAKAKATDDGP